MSAPADLAMLLDDVTVVEIVGDVFAGIFGEDRGRPYPDASPEQLPVGASVSVTGGWHGDVEVSCSTAFANLAAAELFAMSATDVADADVRDVLGELANVVGGNIKSVMPGPSQLSLPKAFLADDGAVPQRSARTDDTPTLSLGLTWSGEPIRVSIWTVPAGPSSKGFSS